MVPYKQVSSDSPVLVGVGPYAQVHVPGAVFGSFQLPAGFCHHATAPGIRLPDISAETGSGNISSAFSVEFVIPGQTIIIVIPAGPVVRPGADPHQAAVQAVQRIVHITGSEAVASHMWVWGVASTTGFTGVSGTAVTSIL